MEESGSKPHRVSRFREEGLDEPQTSMKKEFLTSGPQAGESWKTPPPPVYQNETWEVDTLDGLDDVILAENEKVRAPPAAVVPTASLNAAVKAPRLLNVDEIPFKFHRPRDTNLRKRIFWFGLAAFIVVLVSIGTAVGIVQGSKHHEPAPQNITILISSTLSTTRSTTLHTTFSTTQSTTLVTTEWTTKIQETTIVQTSTVTQTQPTTITQTTTSDHSTSIVQVTTEATTVVQSAATQTVTQSMNPTGFANTCWNMKQDICSGKMQVPPDRQANSFGQCKPLFVHFYCGMIVEFENYGLIVVPIEASPLCSGMRDFCKEIEPSIY